MTNKGFDVTLIVVELNQHMIQHLKNLQQIGLNTNQAKTYLASLELGPSTVIKLSKKTGIIRTTVYDNIRVLKDYGLISEIVENGRHLFVAESPKKLTNVLEKKKLKIEESIPDLLEVFNEFKIRPKLRFFEGVKGIEKILNLSVDGNKTRVTQIMGDIGSLFSWIPEPNMKLFTTKRVKKAIRNYAITTTSLNDLKEFNMLDNRRHRSELREVRVAPEPMSLPLILYRYDSSVALISSTKEGFSVLVESKEFAETFESLFKFIWSFSEEV